MHVQVTIKYSIDDVLRELGQEADIPQGAELLLSTMHDKFFKGGGCESSRAAAAGATDHDAAPLNIAVCMRATR